MRENIAIVGSHPDTRKQFDYGRTDCDVWVFNEAMKEPWVERADGVFQLHQPIIWRSIVNRNDPHHYEWLKSGNTPTIYMIDKYVDVPMAEKYPIEEIKAEFFKNTNIEQHFTSSPAFAIALAIYKGYKHIDVYGIEMETNTEYASQRDGITFWVGFALGRGIALDYHSYKFFHEPLYGYDGGASIPIEYFQSRLMELKEKAKQLDDAFTVAYGKVKSITDAYSDDYKNGIDGLDNAILEAAQAAHDFGAHDGALQSIQRYLKKCELMLSESNTYFLGRQEYEGGSIGGAKERQKATERYNIAGLQLEQVVPQLKSATNKNRRDQVLQELNHVLAQYFKASTEIGITSGVGLENTILMQKHDKIIRAAGGEKSLAVMVEEMEMAK